jgi:hypothetical protein
MNASDVKLSATTAAQSKLHEMLNDCSPGMDCLHLMFASSGTNEDLDGTVTEVGPHWVIGWNSTSQIGHLPYWINCAGFRIFVPQTHLYPDLHGKKLHYSGNNWSFVYAEI